MQLVRVFLGAALVLAGSMPAAEAAPMAEALEISLEGDWDFTWTPSSGEDVPAVPDASAFDVKIAVPGQWDDQLDLFKTAKWWPDAKFTSTLGPVRYLTGIGWYRRTIDAPEAWRGRAARLTVGWAVGQMHVWLNGEHVGSYDYGVYTPYAVDLTNHLKSGQKNELLISVDNTRGFAGGWAFLGNAGKASGITRPVTLEVAAGRGRIEDLYVRPGDDLEEVVWEVELSVPGGSGQAPSTNLIWQVGSGDGDEGLAQGTVAVEAFESAKKVTWKTRIDGIQPWRPKTPNLYTAFVAWTTDEGTMWDAHTQRFGLRRWGHDGRRLLLNGKPIYLRGEFGAYYYPVNCTTPTSKEYWVRHITRAKEIGMNYINFAARVCPVELLETADELGMVLQCGDHMTVLEQYRDYYEEVWTPIVKWTRRHPSMCIYGFGGERNYYEGIIEQYQKQYDLIKSYHPECLVMPQQAIRGIDYAFDEKGKQELTPEPFPHHAERLARYTEACDFFGHYSGGAFGYTYFDTPWQEMEKRFQIYDKPISIHEVFMGMSYLDPDNAAKYTGSVPPYLYTQLEEDLAGARLLDRWRAYHVNSSKLQAICKKHCLEKVRKCNEPSAFEYLGMTDMHFTPHYTTGILDEFGQLKPGDTVEGILRYNGESVLLLDFADGSINRSFWTGEPFEADIMVSLFGERPIDEGKLTWALKTGDETGLRGEWAVAGIPSGQVSVLDKLDITWPTVERTTRCNLSAHLTGAGYDLANDWDFWVFPKFAAPDLAAAADEKTHALLSERYKGLRKLVDAPEEKLRIVSRGAMDDIDHLANGGDVLLLGAAPLPEYTAWTSFRPGLGTREHHNVGSVIAQHPIFENLPHEGWGDWQFYPVLEGATCILFEDDLATAFDPILEIISSAEDVRKHAAIFEKRAGKGRLMVSTCMFDAHNPSCVALMDAMLRYVASDRFRPTDEIPLDVLTRLNTPPAPGEADNLIAEPGFERPAKVKKAWLPYGADYAIDSVAAHTGSSSLRLTIAPEDRKNDPGYYTGARAETVRFTESASMVKVSAWHKTQDLSEGGERDFLIFIYISYVGGGRYTLRMPFESGTHDWQHVEKIWKPEKPIANATLYIGMIRKTGTAWIDDVYFGPAPAEDIAPAEPGVTWHNEPVTVDFKAGGWFRVNDGEWQSGSEARVTQEGVNIVAFKKQQDDEAAETSEIRIDLTPPVITLVTEPPIEQEGGLYFATQDTAFAFEAKDEPAGVRGLLVSIDGKEYAPHKEPLKLAVGRHELRCRATDAAGNATDTIRGSILTGGETDILQVNIR